MSDSADVVWGLPQWLKRGGEDRRGADGHCNASANADYLASSKTDCFHIEYS
ncbi:hypothetical protein [Acaryochloris sp. CCMEE 5410]|uniref:hypothetical protein n=1 Tax=Acaryochloris sp. CCMEE 5410 TaxID=310037 RepID=UPI0021D06E77|nr:hypothetical protein [Acaryochloris sp. CCMEE 5410]KAI9132583.1 hypothetical protein ON05_003885 [Acaryochloris sp. CCMEE 5410]